MDVWAVYGFWLFQTVLLWICLTIYFSEWICVHTHFYVFVPMYKYICAHYIYACIYIYMYIYVNIYKLFCCCWVCKWERNCWVTILIDCAKSSCTNYTPTSKVEKLWLLCVLAHICYYLSFSLFSFRWVWHSAVLCSELAFSWYRLFGRMTLLWSADSGLLLIFLSGCLSFFYWFGGDSLYIVEHKYYKCFNVSKAFGIHILNDIPQVNPHESIRIVRSTLRRYLYFY